jgi:hypothetical protein
MIWLKRIGLLLIIICIGTGLDYIVHNLRVSFGEPTEYFTHKIIFGTFWALVAYIVFRKWARTPFKVAFAMAATTSVLLQTYYFLLEHDPFGKTFFFMFVHFFAFLIPGYYIVKKWRSLFIANP